MTSLSRRQFARLSGAAGTALFGGAASANQGARPQPPGARLPNIVLLMADQFRFDGFAASGSKHMRTPHLDRLAREGCIFSTAHSPTPVSMAARHSLITGLTSQYHGQTGNIEQPIKDYRLPTLPRVLRQLGYATGAVGKMHFYPRREHHGFDEMHLMEELPDYREEDAYLRFLQQHGKGEVRHIHGVRPLLYHCPQRALVPEELHGSSFVATRAIEFIRENRSRPFFLFASWIHPHPPFNIPETFRNHYRDVDVPKPIPRTRHFPFVESPSPWCGDNDSWEVLRRIRESYYSAISLVDKNVGRVLDYLDSASLAQNTLVIFTSDHGEMLADRGFYQKALPYDSAARIPLIVRCPGRIAPGTKRGCYADLLDIFPTMLDLTGHTGKIQLLGNSLFDLYSGARNKQYQFCDWSNGRARWVMVRDQRYKYVYWYNGGTEELYDMQNDPRELRDLIRLGEAPKGTRDELRRTCIQLEAERGPEGKIKNGDFTLFPAAQFHPEMFGKFPLWANLQWPHWGDLAPAREREIMLQEVRSVCVGEPTVPPLNQVFDNQEWRERWKKRWMELGGSDDAYKEIFKL